MLIKSTFRDYYDGVQQFGQDNDFVYQRYQKTDDFVKYGKLKNLLKIQDDFYTDNHNLLGTSCLYGNGIHSRYRINFKKLYIGFCGQIYTAYKVTTIRRFTEKADESETTYCYSFQELEDFIKTQDKKIVNAFYEKEKSKYRSRRKYMTFSSDYFEDKFFTYQNDLISNIFEKNYCPIFFIKYGTNNNNEEKIELIYNYQLSKIDFFKKFDCYQTYQNIRMYLSSLAVPLKPIPELDDETMRDIKGFDEFSFRKDKKNVTKVKK